MRSKEQVKESALHDLYEELLDNKQIKGFLKEEMDVSAYTTQLLSSKPSEIDTKCHEFQLMIDRINHTIEEYLLENYDELIDEMGTLSDDKYQTSQLAGSVNHLKSSIEVITTELQDKHRQLRESTASLQQLQYATEFLYQIRRYWELLEKFYRILHSKTTASSTTTKQQQYSQLVPSVPLTKTLNELQQLLQLDHFQESMYVKQTAPDVHLAIEQIQSKATSHLVNGLEGLDQTKLGKALQIFYYFEKLKQVVQQTIAIMLEKFENTCTTQLEQFRAKRSVMSPGKSRPEAASLDKRTVAANLAKIFEATQTYAIQMWNLQRVLAKIKCPSSNECYLDLVSSDGNNPEPLFREFWGLLCAMLREQLKQALETLPVTSRDAIVQAYPLMRQQAQQMLQAMWISTQKKTNFDTGLARLQAAQANLSRAVQSALKGVGGSPEEADMLLTSLEPVLQQYKSSFFRRISSPIQMMFPSKDGYDASPPSRSDMAVLTTLIISEVNAVSADRHLLENIFKEINKAVKLLCTSVENLVKTSTGAFEFLPPYTRTAIQKHNIVLLGVLHQLDETLANLPERASDNSSKHEDEINFRRNALQQSQDAIHQLGTDITGNYMTGIAVALEKICSRMHEESFSDLVRRDNESGTDTVTAPKTSRFIVEFSKAIRTISSDHFDRLPAAAVFVTRCKKDFIHRLLSTFVQQTCMIRPLEEQGKLRLANDFAQLELVVESVAGEALQVLCPRSYAEFRALRQLIFLDTEAFLRSPIMDQLRPSNVWHHLISRAPEELQLPYQRESSRWSSTLEYISWINTHAGIPKKDMSTCSYPLGYPSLYNVKWSLNAERAVWKHLVASLEAYAQRLSVTYEGSENRLASTIQNTLLESGPALIADYEARCSSEIVDT